MSSPAFLYAIDALVMRDFTNSIAVRAGKTINLFIREIVLRCVDDVK